MGHVRGTAGRSADGKEGKERADMATGVWDLLALFPTAKRRNMGTMGCEQTPPYGRPSKTGFSARAHY